MTTKPPTRKVIMPAFASYQSTGTVRMAESTLPAEPWRVE